MLLSLSLSVGNLGIRPRDRRDTERRVGGQGELVLSCQGNIGEWMVGVIPKSSKIRIFQVGWWIMVDYGGLWWIMVDYGGLPITVYSMYSKHSPSFGPVWGPV